MLRLVREDREGKIHPNNVVRAMALVGYSIGDLLPAYPGKCETYVDQLLRANSLSLNRPVTSYGLLGISPCASQHFNMTEHGYRSNGSAQPWPPAADRTNIFFFGGSTTMGFNVEDGQAIPANVHRKLRSAGVHCEVYNFGCGGYKARHEALRFLDLLDHGVVPDYAVFLDGLNDCYEALGNRFLVDTLNTLYQAERQRRRRSYWAALMEFARTSYAARQSPLPVASFAMETHEKDAEVYLSETGVMKALASSSRQMAPDEITEFQVRLAKSVWEHYVNSVAMIRALAGRYGVRVLFLWQPVPFYKTTEKQRVMDRLHVVYRYGVFSFLVYNWLHLNRFPGMSEASDFHDLSHLGEPIDGVLYADTVHYSPLFCQVIGEAVGAKLLAMLSRKVR